MSEIHKEALWRLPSLEAREPVLLEIETKVGELPAKWLSDFLVVETAQLNGENLLVGKEKNVTIPLPADLPAELTKQLHDVMRQHGLLLLIKYEDPAVTKVPRVGSLSQLKQRLELNPDRAAGMLDIRLLE